MLPTEPDSGWSVPRREVHLPDGTRVLHAEDLDGLVRVHIEQSPAAVPCKRVFVLLRVGDPVSQSLEYVCSTGRRFHLYEEKL